MDSLPILIAVAAAFLLAGFIKGVIGLGLPTVAVGLLGLTMAPTRAAAILVIPSIITNFWQMAAGGRFLVLSRRLGSMLVGVCIGTGIGAVLLPHSDGGEAQVWLGAALVAYALLGLFKVHFSVPPRAEVWIGLLAGLTNGAVTVATGVFVLPGVPYIQSLRMDRDELVQALGIYFTVSTVSLAVALSYAGEMTMSLFWPSLIGLVVAAIGMGLGQLVRGRIKPETFRLCFFLGLLVLGGHLALRGLF